MRAKTFRRIALGLDGVIESAHMSHPDFRVGGRIFATLDGEERRGVVKLTPEQQARFVGEHGDAFTPASGAWGRQGYTRIVLAEAHEETAGEALTLAWQNVQGSGGRQRSGGRRAKAPSRSAKETARPRRSKRP